MSRLILVRHGQSRWNLDNKFTGWVDVPLSKQGISEAEQAASQLKDVNIDVSFTSKLTRAQETLLIILAQQGNTGIFIHNKGKMKKWTKHLSSGKNEIPIYSSEKLNERYYGSLQGMNKDSARKKFGKEQVHKWRRGFIDRPPKAESLKDVYNRTIPYFKKNIISELQKDKNVIVAAHGNSLRAIIKFVEAISDEDIPHLELETGKPIIYDFRDGRFVKETERTMFNRPME